MQAFPELMIDNGPEQFVPKLYGFKIFGMRGSKYEYQYDQDGKLENKEHIDKILNDKKTDAYSEDGVYA
jgi:hypothetical protein